MLWAFSQQHKYAGNLVGALFFASTFFSLCLQSGTEDDRSQRNHATSTNDVQLKQIVAAETNCLDLTCPLQLSKPPSFRDDYDNSRQPLQLKAANTTSTDDNGANVRF